MENVGQDFVDFFLSESPDVAFTQWIKEITQQYKETVQCPNCGNRTVDVVVAPKAFIHYLYSLIFIWSFLARAFDDFCSYH